MWITSSTSDSILIKQADVISFWVCVCVREYSLAATVWCNHLSGWLIGVTLFLSVYTFLWTSYAHRVKSVADKKAVSLRLKHIFLSWEKKNPLFIIVDLRWPDKYQQDECLSVNFILLCFCIFLTNMTFVPLTFSRLRYLLHQGRIFFQTEMQIHSLPAGVSAVCPTKSKHLLCTFVKSCLPLSNCPQTTHTNV